MEKQIKIWKIQNEQMSLWYATVQYYWSDYKILVYMIQISHMHRTMTYNFVVFDIYR